MPSISPARRTAFDVLLRVHSGAWASDLLRAASAPLHSRDAGLASEIVFGTLRYQAQLDHLIDLRTPKARLDPEVRIALRIGFYQLLHLTRVPPHAVVVESVELVKRARKRSAAGLVNAVLRKPLPPSIEWPDEATRLSIPSWLHTRWQTQYGEEKTKIIAAAALSPPDTYLRFDTFDIPPSLRVEPTEVPGCFRLLSGDPAGFRRQDIGSQWVVTLLDLHPGLTFLDLCSAPGNKTAHALEFGVRAIASDLHLHRLRSHPNPRCPLVCLDATRPLPFRRVFDRILVDASCSGTGTLSRNPEIKWRLTPEDLPHLHRRQTLILRNALDCLAPGGLLVYSTCSLEREENEDVLNEVLGSIPAQTHHRFPGLQPGDGFFAAVIRSD
ncbi:MAG: hypothetical protein IT165_27010 [Bryobacterales bacterium]|nr:hypothetical protein [Bryobacterales bacterium]